MASDTKETTEKREMYRGYEIRRSDWGWFNIRRQSFGVASFLTREEAHAAIDTLCEKGER
jgi:hypothetical protein